MGFAWDALPTDVQACILRALAHSLVGHHWPGCITRKAHRERQLELVCLSKQVAKHLQIVLALYTAPWEPQYSAEAFVEAYLRHVFCGQHGVRIATPDNYSFLYTAIYTGACTKPAHNRAAAMYRLLGHTLTALLRRREIEWKGLGAVKNEMRFVHTTCKYLDRFFVARHGLPTVVKRLKKAYLAGNPDHPKEPTYTDPPLEMVNPFV